MIGPKCVWWFGSITIKNIRDGADSLLNLTIYLTITQSDAVV